MSHRHAIESFLVILSISCGKVKYFQAISGSLFSLGTIDGYEMSSLFSLNELNEVYEVCFWLVRRNWVTFNEARTLFYAPSSYNMAASVWYEYSVFFSNNICMPWNLKLSLHSRQIYFPDMSINTISRVTFALCNRRVLYSYLGWLSCTTSKYT